MRRHSVWLLLLIMFTAMSSSHAAQEPVGDAWREAVLYVPGSAFPVEMLESDYLYDFAFDDKPRDTGYHVVLHKESSWLSEVRMDVREQRGSSLASLPPPVCS